MINLHLLAVPPLYGPTADANKRLSGSGQQQGGIFCDLFGQERN